MRRTLVIMAKAPIVGKVKTRLCPPLGAQSAALLHESFIRDAFEKASSVPDAETVMAYGPRGTASFFRETACDADGYILQRGSHLGERISNCFDRLSERGRSVVVMGADSPTLPARCLELAFDVLDTGRADTVLGPTSGGGFYLVGLLSPQPKLFGDVVWSGPNVAAASVEKAKELGLRMHLLPEWYHVDRSVHLAHLRAELLERKVTNRAARHTRERLQSFVERGLL